MKWLSLLSVMAIAPEVSGFKVTECGAQPATHEFHERGNDKCQKMPWPKVNSMGYQSNVGCVLAMYSDYGCQGKVYATRDQQACHAPNFTIVSVDCRGNGGRPPTRDPVGWNKGPKGEVG